MSREYSLTDMVDLALATPKIGVVNCFMLHALLHALIKRLNIGDCTAYVLAKGDDNTPFTEMPDSKDHAEGSGGGSVLVSLSPTESGSTKDESAAEHEKREEDTRSQRPDGATTSHGRDGDDTRHGGPTGSSGQAGPDGPATPSGGDHEDDEDGDSKGSQRLQGESSADRKDPPSQGSESSKKKGSGPKGSKSQPSGPAGSKHQRDSGPTSPSGQVDPDGSKPQRDGGLAGSSDQSKSKATEGPHGGREEEGGDSKKPLGDFLHGTDTSPTSESSSPTGQFGIPYIENGVHLLAYHLKDVPELVKDLQQKIAENEDKLSKLREDNKGMMDALQNSVCDIMERLEPGTKERLEPGTKRRPRARAPAPTKATPAPAPAPAAPSSSPAAPSSSPAAPSSSSPAAPSPPAAPTEVKTEPDAYEDLEVKVDRMIEMSNDLELRVLDKLPEGQREEKPIAKGKSKKEPRRPKKDAPSGRDRKSSGSEVELSEVSDKEKTSKGKRKARDISTQAVEARNIAPGRGVADLDPAAQKAGQQVSGSGSGSGSGYGSTSEGVSEGEKPLTGEPNADGAGMIPKKKKHSLLTLKPSTRSSQEGMEGMENLQKKVNMVLRLMSKMEKAMTMVPDIGRGVSGLVDKDELGSDDVKPEGSRYDHESPKHKEAHAHYQLLNNRVKRIEEEIQKLFTLISSESSSASNLTKMVSDFLNTVSKTSAAVEDPEPKPKKTRKERAKKDDDKGVEEGNGAERGEEEGERGEKEEGKEEEEGAAVLEKKEETAVVEESSEEEEVLPVEIHEMPIKIDVEPEKLSDLWDQIKILAEAFRGMKSNVSSLENNSKNMAKALQMLMKGNSNIVDEDFEIIGEVKMVVRKILADLKHLDGMVSTDRESLDGLRENVENLFNDFDGTKGNWSEKMENLRLEMMTKAKGQDLDIMVSSVQKKLNIVDYRREFDQLTTDIKEQDGKFMSDIQALKNDKYDRFEMDIFRMWVECKVNTAKKLPQDTNTGLEAYEDDASLLKTKIPYNCLSCDKTLLITPHTRLTHRELIVIPLSKRTRPMTANEVDSSRLLRKRNVVTKGLMGPIQKVLLEGTDNKLYQGNRKSGMNKSPEEENQKTSENNQLPATEC